MNQEQYDQQNSSSPEDNATSTTNQANSPLQSKEAFEVDKTGDHLEQDTTRAENSASATETKEYGDTELNKGLEAQAMDEEGTNL